MSFSKFIKTYGSYADYTDILDFSMRESSFTIDSLIDESYVSGVLFMDQDHLLEVINNKI